MVRLAITLLMIAGATAIIGGEAGCKSQADAPPSSRAEGTEASTAAVGKVREVAAKDGDVEPIVRDALDGARADGRTVVVYVGATWCEPCQHFHHAAERGELDAMFPRMTLLEFDLDRDRERLAAAGYTSKYIPLLALPRPDGAASGKQIEGGIKGDGAVAFISGRLKQMLSE